MLDAAGVCACRLLAHAEAQQKLGQHRVARIHLPRDGEPRTGECDAAAYVHGQIPVFAQALGSVADAGLAHAQMLGHVDRANIAVLFLHHQHGFKIIL